MFTDFDGDRTAAGRGAVAANPALHADVLARLQASASSSDLSRRVRVVEQPVEPLAGQQPALRGQLVRVHRRLRRPARGGHAGDLLAVQGDARPRPGAATRRW